MCRFQNTHSLDTNIYILYNNQIVKFNYILQEYPNLYFHIAHLIELQI